MKRYLLVALIAFVMIGCKNNHHQVYDGDANDTIEFSDEVPASIPEISDDGTNAHGPCASIEPPFAGPNATSDINIFIENSGSMNGFINEQSDF